MKLFEKVTVGRQTLKNSIAMAPMTRSRANSEGVVNDLTVLYYTQRASAGLIITEGINISEQALGSPWTPGIFTREQIEAWKKVTSSVHDNGGLIYAQLWHTGRVGHSVDRKGKLPVAPSAIAIKGQHFTSQGMKDYETPHELTIDEIRQVVSDYGQAAKNAIEPVLMALNCMLLSDICLTSFYVKVPIRELTSMAEVSKTGTALYWK